MTLREVSGYLSAFGGFFEQYEEARLDEAANILIRAMGRSLYVTHEHADAFITFINSHCDEVLEYASAYKALYQKEENSLIEEMRLGEVIDDGQATCQSASAESETEATPSTRRTGGGHADGHHSEDSDLRSEESAGIHPSRDRGDS